MVISKNNEVSEAQEQTENAGHKPVMTVKIGAFQTSVFLNEIKTDNGNAKVPSVTFQKSWTKDKGKTWERQRMNLFNTEEIDKAITVLQQTKVALYEKTYEN